MLFLWGFGMDTKAEEKFLRRINYDTGTDCIEWASNQSSGYGSFQANGVKWLAHRYAYTREFGEIPEGMVIDHRCNNRSCVNPYHLRAVTTFQNAQNTKPQLFTKSGVKGVAPSRKRWRASITANGITYYLGIYKTKEEAKAAYDKAVFELHGPFGYKNLRP